MGVSSNPPLGPLKGLEIGPSRQRFFWLSSSCLKSRIELHLSGGRHSPHLLCTTTQLLQVAPPRQSKASRLAYQLHCWQTASQSVHAHWQSQDRSSGNCCMSAGQAFEEAGLPAQSRPPRPAKPGRGTCFLRHSARKVHVHLHHDRDQVGACTLVPLPTPTTTAAASSKVPVMSHFFAWLFSICNLCCLHPPNIPVFSRNRFGSRTDLVLISCLLLPQVSFFSSCWPSLLVSHVPMI